MAESLFSASWHRVAQLKPRLRSHIEINRHVYRGDVWYVVQDDASGRYHRFTPQAYCLIGLMNGRRTLDDLWHSAGEQLGDDMPSQDEVIRLLSQLYRVDVIQTDVTPDIGELSQRRQRDQQNRLLAIFKSPLAIKIPLLDPEPFLNRTAGLSRWLFNPVTALLWLFCIGWALSQAAYHWPQLTENLADRVLAAENLFLIWLAYPVVKLVHEFGHAYAVKRWGGEVHEMGVMFLIFMPIPYVDASSSASFRSKYQRMLVAAAGIMVEASIAALAMWVWVHAEPGVVRSLAFNTLLIAGVSTVLFNGNPLLRFDAYYVLADWLEIPNLGARSTRQVAYLCKRYLLGLSDETSPAYSRREAWWLFCYALASFVYRVFITLTIVLFVASELFFIGILLAMLSLYNMFGKPLLAILKYLTMDRSVLHKRGRILAVTLGLGGLLFALLFVMPVPKMTLAQGIFWAPEEAQVQARSNGFLQQIEVASGQSVDAGQVLFVSDNPQLEADLAQAVGRLKELMVLYQTAIADERRNETGMILEEITQARATLARYADEQRDLTLRSRAQGAFQLALPVDPLGRLIPRGTLMGYLLQPGDYRVRVAVGQDDVESIRNDLQGLNVRLSEQVEQELPARMLAEVPSAQKILPSPALSVTGGGQFALDPGNQEQPEAFDTVFLFDVGVDNLPIQKMGERVYVRFEHTPEAIGFRIYRNLRRVLLRELEF
ncbi:hypothetical protein A8C75_16350 [Marinobacterium aestuarii]|uniref:Peptidase M50 domain-containing protein n=1 Tax=Marinobacterium aestuarii TaxID=1821621 RepID=A0A1A9F1C1_9GAMM|nr:site-2 protease family protein [Marinobacterium aestuarii]ANG63892.1 hypothetical protein A8C75_16350 [Marinobacterium aestuarii]